MDNQLILILRQKLDDLAPHGEVDVETQRNVLKEELQYYVLNFIFHHPEYGKWIMYGGSALRICHGLNRMSVDLDFEINHRCDEKFLKTLKTEIEKHFSGAYGLGADFLTVKITHGRGLLLRFVIGGALGIGHPSKQVHVKIDLNPFVMRKTATERIPINHDQLSFVITTYNMSTLMASKIAAIFLRGKRGVGEAIYEEKGRDIYDLLWYMEKKTVPDLGYLTAKGVDIGDLRGLFDKLTLQMNKVNNANLKQDLLSLFLDRSYIQNWLKQWLEHYLRLKESYSIHIVTKLQEIQILQDVRTDDYSFFYTYQTGEGGNIKIKYSVTYEMVKFMEGGLSIPVNDTVMRLARFETKETDQLRRYATLFYQKTEAYFKKTKRILLGNSIITKKIRMTADKLDQKEQIVLNKSTLLSCSLEDLLK